jgi:hypothetical protein
MLEKLYPKTMQPILAAMDVGWNAQWLAIYDEAKKAKRLRWLVLYLHEKPTRAQIAHFLLWFIVCIGVAAAIRATGTQNPIWGQITAILLALLFLVSKGWLSLLEPKNPMTRDTRWGKCAAAFRCTRNTTTAMDIAYAKEDLSIHDSVSNFFLHTLVIGALVNASINNKFVDAVSLFNLKSAWLESYVGTASIVAIPFAFFARVLLFSGPMNWVRQIERRL